MYNMRRFWLLVLISVCCSSSQAAGLAGDLAVAERIAVPAMATQPTQAAQSSKSLQVEVQAPSHSRREQPPLWPSQFSISQLVGRTLVVSGLLAVACVVSLWLGNRRLRSGQGSGAAGVSMRLVDTLLVAPRCCLHVVTVDGQKFLLARDATGWKSVTAVSSFGANLEEAESPASVSLARTEGATDHASKRRNVPWQDLPWPR